MFGERGNSRTFVTDVRSSMPRRSCSSPSLRAATVSSAMP